MEARTKTPVQDETCFFRDGQRSIGINYTLYLIKIYK